MKYTIIFTAEITEDIPDCTDKDVELSEEENKKIIEMTLREISSKDAEIIVHDFKLIERN